MVEGPVNRTIGKSFVFFQMSLIRFIALISIILIIHNSKSRQIMHIFNLLLLWWSTARWQQLLPLKKSMFLME